MLLLMATDDPSPEQIERAARAVWARMEETGLVYANIEAGGIGAKKGPTRLTTRNFVTKGRWIRKRDIRSSLALALGWQADSIDRLARGEDPVELETGETNEVLRAISGLRSELGDLREHVLANEATIARILLALEGQPDSQEPPG